MDIYEYDNSMKKLLIFFMILSGITQLGHDLYFKDLDLFNLNSIQANIEWVLRLIRDMSVIFAVSLSIIISYVNFSIQDNKKKPAIYLSLSILLCVSLSAFTVYMHNEYKKSPFLSQHAILSDSELIEKYDKLITSKKESLPERIRLSHTAASNFYIDTGKIFNVIKDSGEKGLYVPTQKDKNERIKLLHAKKVFAHAMDSFKYASIIWIAVIFVSLFIAVILVKNRKSLIKQDS